jgi:hypothetical protein
MLLNALFFYYCHSFCISFEDFVSVVEPFECSSAENWETCSFLTGRLTLEISLAKASE